MTGLISIVNGDALHIPLRDGVVQIVVTSPPYWSLRDYGVNGQLGIEPTPEAYIANMVAVFREVWRVMRPDGTLWLNIGDCYNSASAGNGISFRRDRAKVAPIKSKRIERGGGRYGGGNARVETLKPKDLMMMPARLALALQADGWWIRSDIIWAKPNPMPESVTDRPTKSYEHIFLLTKAEHYYFDADAIREKTGNEMSAEEYAARTAPGKTWQSGGMTRYAGANKHDGGHSHPSGRNRRDVWPIATESFSGAHFATFPQKLVEPMILAGSSPQACETCGAPWERVVSKEFLQSGPEREHISGGTQPGANGWVGMPRGNTEAITLGWRPTCACPPERNTGAGRCIVLDPFAGTCTVGKVAIKHGRRFVGLELKSEYIALARERTDHTQMVMQV